MRPHGKIKLDTARKAGFVVMAEEYDWINIRQSLNPVRSVPGGDVTRGRQGGFSCGSAGHILFLEASVVLRRHPTPPHPPPEFQTGWRRTFICVEPGQAAVTVILSHCLLKTGLIIRPAGAISVGSEQVTLIIRANWVACSYVIHLLT